jgi:lycopene cyclase domain-containing protein
LILVWALPPVLMQVSFGADILFANRRLLLAAILPTTLYLWLVDAIAIRSGTWTIDPGQTTGLALGGLPLEEMLFFLMTNLIIAFGITLMLSPASKSRLQSWLESHALGLPSTGVMFQTLALVAWILVMIATPIVVWIWGAQAFARMAILGVVMHLTATLAALSLGWPWARLLRLAAIVWFYTWLVEAIGAATGFPFGRYSYTSALGPQLAGVPLVIPLAWLMLLPPAWAVADAVLSPWRSRLGSWYRLTFAILAGLAITAWDLYLDPQMVARGLWVWENPAGYFGIPWSNYLGWLGASALLTWLIQPTQLRRMPLLLIYSLTWILQAIGLGLFWGQPGPALVGFLVMGLFVLWAWTQERREWKLSFGLRWGTSAVRSRSQSL